MIVDALVPDPRRPGSIRVQVGGRPAWTVPADVVAALALAPGQRLGGDAVTRLDLAAEEEGAFRAGLRALERRSHAGAELAQKLHRKGHVPAAVEAALTRLTRLGLLDDVAFARHYVEARAARGRGPVRLRRDLQLLGVERSVIDMALRALDDPEVDPLAVPKALAARRSAQLAGLPRDVRRRRVVAFLARRGFGGQAVRSIVDEVLCVFCLVVPLL